MHQCTFNEAFSIVLVITYSILIIQMAMRWDLMKVGVCFKQTKQLLDKLGC